MGKIDAVFTQRCDEDGLTKAEIMKLLEHLDLNGEEEVLPIVAEGDISWTFGFIRDETVSDQLGDDVGKDSAFVTELLTVVNNMHLETPDNLYDFAGVKTLMYY